MSQASTDLFTIGVFQDVAWAEKGLQALKAKGFTPDMISIIAKDSPEVAALTERALEKAAPTLDIRGIGGARAAGSLIDALQGTDQELVKHGIAASARRVGFQSHDGRIFETLTARGGVLVAVAGEPRAADALALLHSYGGGNAAIGAWAGRV
jgi:hypothetical protein